MSRSKKRSPFTAITTAESEKDDKRTANRKFRRKLKQSIFNQDESLPLIREVSNVWSFGKDGKRRIVGNLKLLRK
jgi:hypothetical protein